MLRACRTFRPPPRARAAAPRAGSWLALATALLLVAAPSPAASAAAPASEHDIRAAMLLNFARFTDWPATATAGPEDPFVLGVIASDGMVKALEFATRGKRVGARALVVQRWTSLEAARAGAHGCQMIYLGDEGDAAARVLLRELDGEPVLLVGACPGFTRLGGAIGFVVENRHLRFEISQRSLERSGLRVSSKLLELAKLADGPRRTP